MIVVKGSGPHDGQACTMPKALNIHCQEAHLSVAPGETCTQDPTPIALLCWSVGSRALAGHRGMRRKVSHCYESCSAKTAILLYTSHVNGKAWAWGTSSCSSLQSVQTTHCSSGHATPQHKSVLWLALVHQMPRFGITSPQQRRFHLPLGMSAAQLSRFILARLYMPQVVQGTDGTELTRARASSNTASLPGLFPHCFFYSVAHLSKRNRWKQN